MTLLNYTNYKAIFFDKNGVIYGRKSIDSSNKNFKYSDGSYIFDESASYYEFNILNLYTIRHYFYNFGNPEPIYFNKDRQSLFTAQIYNRMIDNEVIKRLHDLARENWLAKLLTTRNLIIIAVIGGLYWWIKSHGGKLW